VLVSHPIQYFVPVYRELEKTSDIDLTVIYRTRVGVDSYYDPGFGQQLKWDIPLLEGYKSRFLSEKNSLRGFEVRIVKELISHRFDVLIVHGYNRLTNLLAISVAKLIGTRVIIRGDTRLQTHHRHAPAWKKLIKRLLFRAFDGFLTIGTLNREYYVAFGADAGRIFFAPFCVNNATFTLGSDVHLRVRQQYRSALGLPNDSVVFLYAAKLTAQKRPSDLIKAYAVLAQQYPNAWLLLAGSGVEEKSLKAMVAALNLERVRFFGFQNQSALPSLYAASDIFVLPSEAESWGLVLNEAMASGLPVITSDQVGSYPDLVKGQGSGIVYPCGDVGALSQAMSSLIQAEQMRLEMGLRARELIKEWDVATCAASIVSMVKRLART